LVEDSAVPVEADAEATAPIPSIEYIGVVHLTRTWVQYGIFGFAVICIVIGAVEALFGR
jgi:xanthine/uracil permease